MHIHDCQPTLTDRQVMEFCSRGYLALEGVVDDETNQRTVEYLNRRDDSELLGLLTEEWFAEGVLRNPRAAGAARSLLGAHFVLPHVIANHRGKCPDPEPVAWHCDGYSWHTIELKHLMMFYLPQACTPDMGPTEFVPGSHFLGGTSHLVHHYGNIVGTTKAIGAAGTVLLTEPTLWHRRSRTRTSGPVRHLLKYHCWRQSPPVPQRSGLPRCGRALPVAMRSARRVRAPGRTGMAVPGRPLAPTVWHPSLAAGVAAASRRPTECL